MNWILHFDNQINICMFSFFRNRQESLQEGVVEEVAGMLF
jgi:hypothetical protein